MLDLASGSITKRKVCPMLQPSSLAASSRSRGRLIKACFKRKVPKAVTSPGNTSANIVSSIFILLIIRYWGMRNIWLGTIIWKSTREKAKFLPLKFSLAKA